MNHGQQCLIHFYLSSFSSSFILIKQPVLPPAWKATVALRRDGAGNAPGAGMGAIPAGMGASPVGSGELCAS